eukprot:TRINITY_DN61475_c0_g1_i1.p1 TRINITY_DN61475_c0_g1~~TRINITY_DN61475_c0_g1_i1.p1  ORF type:complete len:399 (-),score=41.18 TRINITY_DN61475_c0_g1_i1:36-1232(-)
MASRKRASTDCSSSSFFSAESEPLLTSTIALDEADHTPLVTSVGVEGDDTISSSNDPREMRVHSKAQRYMKCSVGELVVFIKANVSVLRASSIGARFELLAAAVKREFVLIEGKIGSTIVYFKVKLAAGKQFLWKPHVSAKHALTSTVESWLTSMHASLNSMASRIGRRVQPSIALCCKLKGGLLHVHSIAGEAVVYIETAACRGTRYIGEIVRPLSISFKNGYVHVTRATSGMVCCIKAPVVDACCLVAEQAASRTQGSRARVNAAARFAIANASSVVAQARTIAADEKFQMTAGSAACGAIAFGATGGAAGLVTGGAFGAVVGIVPAVFTLGASIPIGAVVGGSTGLCLGTIAGSTAGFVGGGVAGFKVKSSAGSETRMSSCKRFVADTATLIGLA